MAFQVVSLRVKRRLWGLAGLGGQNEWYKSKYVYGLLGLSRVAPDRDIQE